MLNINKGNGLRGMLLLLGGLWLIPVAQAERLDAIAAVVNGEAVTCYEVEAAKQSLKTQLQQQGGVLPSEQVLFERALDARVVRTLQHQEARQLDIVISPDEVDAAIADIEKRNNLQAGQLQEVLKAQGVDMDTYRETLRDRLLNSRLINLAVRSKLNVSEEAMREYYRKHLQNPKPVREVRIAQMFVALPAEADAIAVESTRQRAEAYYQRLQTGEDFTRLVALESDAPNASEGGDMGWVSPGAVKGAFAQVFQLAVGDITKPIRSAAGFHIVKVMDERMRKPENLLPYEEVHARHILLRVPEDADLQTQIKIREQAEKIAEEMQGTSDEAFAVRAKEISQGPSAARGGDLGWFRRGRMVPVFEETAFAMQPGETSGVVSSEFGLHIIRLVDKRTVNPNSFIAHKQKIQQLLIDTEMQQQVPRWMNELKAKAQIETRTCDGAMSPSEVNKLQGDVMATKVATPEKPTMSEQEADDVVEDMGSDEAAKLALLDWKDAWEAQDMDAYFAAYDTSTSPSKRFKTFAQWKAYKQRVVPSNRNIQISVSNFETKILDKDKRIQLTFDQHFQSKKFDDHDRKVVVMQNVDGVWKIVSEETIK